MSDAVTSYESWTGKGADGAFCWNCKVGQYLVYSSDATQTSRCGQCGELEQDDPAKVETPKTRPAAKRAAAKPKEKV